MDNDKRIQIAALFMDKFALYTDNAERKRDLARFGLAFADALIEEAERPVNLHEKNSISNLYEKTPEGWKLK